MDSQTRDETKTDGENVAATENTVQQVVCESTCEVQRRQLQRHVASIILTAIRDGRASLRNRLHAGALFSRRRNRFRGKSTRLCSTVKRRVVRNIKKHIDRGGSSINERISLTGYALRFMIQTIRQLFLEGGGGQSWGRGI